MPSSSPAPFFCALGIGYGISLGIMDNAAISAVEPERMGMAAGMFNTVRLTADVVSMAGLGALVTALTKAGLDTGSVTRYPDGADDLTSRALQGGLHDAAAEVPAGAGRDSLVDSMTSAYTGGIHGAMWIVAAACALGVVLVGALLSGKRSDADGVPAASPQDQTAAAPVG